VVGVGGSDRMTAVRMDGFWVMGSRGEVLEVSPTEREIR